MKTVKAVEVTAYDPTRYGLFKSKHRKTRVYFRELGAKQRMPDDPARTYAGLLPAVYERIARSPLAPLPMPDRIRPVWNETEGAFTLSGLGLYGFSVTVEVQTKPDEQEHENEPESVIEARNGGPLPRIAL